MPQQYQPGRHFVQIPGPTNIPERVLRAMAAPTIDHRGPEFAQISKQVLQGVKAVFQTSSPVMIFPSSGSGAWEAALVNTLSPGDKLLMFETGQFAALWRGVAERMGFEVQYVPGDWRRGADIARAEEILAQDADGGIKAVCLVHNETSTSVTSDVAGLRKAMDRAGHAALLMVDTISSLGSIDYRHEEWGVDVTVCCSQKGLMLPPGLGFNAVSPKALDASRNAAMPRSYWRWDGMLANNSHGLFPLHPAHQSALRLERGPGHDQ